jgi:hypothetical protein
LKVKAKSKCKAKMLRPKFWRHFKAAMTVLKNRGIKVAEPKAAVLG